MSVGLTILKVICSLVSVFLYLSPSVRMRRVIKAKTTGETPFLPLICMFCNYHTWMLHGIFIDDIFPIATTFSLGNVLGLTYTIIYLRYTPDRKVALKICAVAFSLMGLLSLYAVLCWAGVIHQTHKDTGDVIGYVAVVTTFAFFSSPFATVRKVLRTKSAESLIIQMILMATLNNGAWAIYAFCISDWFMFVPNSICFVFDLLQIYLYLKFRDQPQRKSVAMDVDTLAISIVISPKNAQMEARGALSPTYELLHSPKLAPIDHHH